MEACRFLIQPAKSEVKYRLLCDQGHDLVNDELDPVFNLSD